MAVAGLHLAVSSRGDSPSVALLFVPAQQALDMPPCLLEMESAEAAAEEGEASLLRAELDSKGQCCDGAVGESSEPSSSHFCFLQCSEKRHWMLEPLVELLDQHLLDLLCSRVC